jgi:choline kinase
LRDAPVSGARRRNGGRRGQRIAAANVDDCMAASQPLQVVILAAGEGLRLGAAGSGRPKALLALAGRTLLRRAIDFAAALGATRIVVVGGRDHADVAAEALAARNATVRVVENARFRAGNLLSVRAALAAVDDTLLLVNVDHVFPPGAVVAIRGAMECAVTAYCQFARDVDADEMKVEIDARRRLRRISKTLAPFDGAYIGMTYVPAARLDAWRHAIDAVAASVGDAAVAEQVLQRLADDGEEVRTASLDGVRWAEIDTPADLARAQALCAEGAI